MQYLSNEMFFHDIHGLTILALKPICLDFIKPTNHPRSCLERLKKRN